MLHGHIARKILMLLCHWRTVWRCYTKYQTELNRSRTLFLRSLLADIHDGPLNLALCTEAKVRTAPHYHTTHTSKDRPYSASALLHERKWSCDLVKHLRFGACMVGYFSCFSFRESCINGNVHTIMQSAKLCQARNLKKRCLSAWLHARRTY